jgi:DNA-binding CsgD family transcriptional regulator
MTRIGLGHPLGNAVRRLPHRWLERLPLDSPPARVAMAHAGAMVVVALVLAAQQPHRSTSMALIIATTLSVLRSSSAAKRLAVSTLILDAVGMVILLAGTGATDSAYFAVALAGVWWAAQIPRSHSGLIYALGFAIAYGLLVVPVAAHDRTLSAAIGDVLAMAAVAILADSLVRIDRRAVALSDAIHAAPFSAEQLAIREGLSRALGTMDVPVDVVLAAAQVGLTALQAELLAYLVAGLTNQEIGDATGVSEAAVRYRLTRVYRALGVGGRREAARRAGVLGLSGAEAVGSSPRSRR